MSTRLLLGDEALAQGAIDAGLSGAYGYPGTPSTEITEYVQKSPEARGGDVRGRWTANEKTALEAALGMCYAGKRAMASMKHVGLNVAADPFINAALAGTNGGLLVNVADDPSMHSSQNEQDSRLYTEIALVPCFEPANQQEAHDVPAYAFDLSERHKIPVLIRLVTRLAHSRAPVALGPKRRANPLSPSTERERFILLPANARRSYERLVRLQRDLQEESEKSPFNRFTDGDDRSLGVIACGIAHNYLLEVTGGAPRFPVLKIGQYPLPLGAVARLVGQCREVLVLEEGYPFVESRLVGLLPRTSPTIRGRLSGDVPRTGELSPQSVASALGLATLHGLPASCVPAARPPALCPGCPHADTCRILNDVLSASEGSGRVFSDIGCYTLGALPPYSAIDTCVEMGASITMAKGASDAGVRPAIALIGDSTFAHSGMTGLLDCVNEDSDVTIVIVDNSTVAMTGGQTSAAENRLVAICEGLGVSHEHVRVVEPLPGQHAENVAVFAEEIAHPGLSVIIARRECIQTLKRRARRPADVGGAQ
ncbi:MAG: indolepyruvate ferredoxin oxidoreductase subunit alpha [Candidatus Bipolaricaulota bacterium]|nr:indolepyruvate ferredoxin oxidoreductase subunit alpha [Candidatus Bipolaricaulota bacterium]